MVIAMSEPMSPPVRSGPHGTPNARSGRLPAGQSERATQDPAPGGRLRAAESPGATQDSATQRISLREQAEAAQRELARRHRVFAGLARSGRMSADEAAREIDLMRAIRDTLRLFAAHEGRVRAALVEGLAAERRRRTADELAASEPAVAAVLDRFPEAELVAEPEDAA